MTCGTDSYILLISTKKQQMDRPCGMLYPLPVVIVLDLHHRIVFGLVVLHSISVGVPLIIATLLVTQQGVLIAKFVRLIVIVQMFPATSAPIENVRTVARTLPVHPVI